jgi:hypothetical protein
MAARIMAATGAILLVIACTAPGLTQSGQQSGGYWLPQAPAGYGAPAQAQPKKSHVAIRNASNQQIVFLLKGGNAQNWDKHTLYPHQGKTYYAPGPGQGHFDIQVATADRGYVQYHLKSYMPYSIAWDKGKGVWDVRTEK